MKMTGARLFAEMMCGYEVSHIFFVPAFILKATRLRRESWWSSWEAGTRGEN
mgnify:CR=1 FL=1